jgi:hypothetical protein
MAKPYSIDLRERVVGVVEQEGLSRRRAAARFGVSYSAAIDWVKRHRVTGSLAPGRIGGHCGDALSLLEGSATLLEPILVSRHAHLRSVYTNHTRGVATAQTGVTVVALRHGRVRR